MAKPATLFSAKAARKRATCGPMSDPSRATTSRWPKGSGVKPAMGNHPDEQAGHDDDQQRIVANKMDLFRDQGRAAQCARRPAQQLEEGAGHEADAADHVQHEGAHDEWVVGREIEAKMLLERGSYDWHSAANSERLDDGDKWQPEQERIPPDVFKVDRPQCFKDGQRFHGV